MRRMYGRDLARGTPVNMGEAVGVIAAQSIGEPGTQLTMRTFHIGGAAQISEQSFIELNFDGKIKFKGKNIAKNSDNEVVAMVRNMVVAVVDPDGTERAHHRIPYGARLRVEDGDKIKRGQRIAEWDPYTRPILTEVEGDVAFEDMVDGLSMSEQLHRRHLLRLARSADSTVLMAEPLLEVKGLKVRFATEDGVVRAVDGVDLQLERGKVLGIVGESGSGKSVTAMTLLGLTRGQNAAFEGEVVYKGQNLLTMPESRLRDIRGNEIAMIFQDPMTSLNPVLPDRRPDRRGDRRHEAISKKQARRRAIDLLKQVGHSERHGADRHISAPAVRRHAPAGHDRDGSLLQPGHRDRRRADDGARRDDPGPDPRPARRSAGRVRLRRDPDHARPRRRRVDRPRHPRHVRGPRGRAAPTRELFYDPQMPYTWGLLGSIPRLDRPKQEKLHSITGSPPSLINAPRGCKFRPRCPHVFDRCIEEPELVNRVEAPDHLDRCWLSLDDKRRLRGETIAPAEASIA